MRKSELKPLPFAREEIAVAAKALGKNSVELDGVAASEAALKALALGDFKIIHIAAHGIGNEAEPDRAALLLALRRLAELIQVYFPRMIQAVCS